MNEQIRKQNGWPTRNPIVLAMQADADRRLAHNAAIARRAAAIADRVLPELPAAHGFYEPAAFVARCQRRSDRNKLRASIRGRLAERTK